MVPSEKKYVEKLLIVLCDDEKKMREQIIHLDGRIAYNVQMQKVFEGQLAIYNSTTPKRKETRKSVRK